MSDLGPGIAGNAKISALVTATGRIWWSCMPRVNALNRLRATRTMERYLGYIINIAAAGGASAVRTEATARIDAFPDRPLNYPSCLPEPPPVISVFRPT
jgi:hypothetical protein